MIHHRRLLGLVILTSCSIVQQRRADAFAVGAGFRSRTAVVKNCSLLPHPFSAPRSSAAGGAAAAVRGRSALILLKERQLRQRRRPLFSKDSEKLEREKEEGELETVYIDTSQEEVPEDVQAELVDNQPSEWAIMKEVRKKHGRQRRQHTRSNGKNEQNLLTVPFPIFTSITQLLGINVFTYVLAIAIAFFLSMNVLLGPGWLGNTIGLPGTGTFTETSESLPDTFDLSEDAYLLK